KGSQLYIRPDEGQGRHLYSPKALLLALRRERSDVFYPQDVRSPRHYRLLRLVKAHGTLAVDGASAVLPWLGYRQEFRSSKFCAILDAEMRLRRGEATAANSI